ncbi:MAG: hypothetical protein LBE08_06910 [Bifidobacteriaceae bacterium]|jgi:hypothetical protein|nr:hypothetical protein [Bifidobacteriaceae bacterium]
MHLTAGHPQKSRLARATFPIPHPRALSKANQGADSHRLNGTKCAGQRLSFTAVESGNHPLIQHHPVDDQPAKPMNQTTATTKPDHR